jgi:hypothetical protein
MASRTEAAARKHNQGPPEAYHDRARPRLYNKGSFGAVDEAVDDGFERLEGDRERWSAVIGGSRNTIPLSVAFRNAIPSERASAFGETVSGFSAAFVQAELKAR